MKNANANARPKNTLCVEENVVRMTAIALTIYAAQIFKKTAMVLA